MSGETIGEHGLKYNNPTKATWRGWAWNQMKKRLPPGSRVLVLAGNSAGDLKWGQRHGFECVAIDVDQKCVDYWRKVGGIAVRDDLHSQVRALQPRGVIADMTGGIRGETVGMLFDAALICDAVVANLRRGQDKGIRHHNGTVVNHLANRRKRIELVAKHRGKIAFTYLAKLIAEDFLSTEFDESAFESIGDITKPSFYSYKSQESKRSAYYDSVALSTSSFELSLEQRELMSSGIDQQSKRKAAAAKALLTMQRSLN